MEQPKPEPLSWNFWKHNSNKYLIKRQSLTCQMILCITVNESLHNASKQDKPLCYRQCESFFHLTTANIHWTRAQRVCLWGQPRKKVHQQVPATLQHAELHIQSFTQKHSIRTTNTHGWADASRHLTPELEAPKCSSSLWITSEENDRNTVGLLCPLCSLALISIK